MQIEQFRRQFARCLASSQIAEAMQVLRTWRAQTESTFEPDFHAVQCELRLGQYRQAMDRALQLRPTGDCDPGQLLELVQCLSHFAAHDQLIAWAREYPHRERVAPRDAAAAAADFSAVGAHDLALTWVESATRRAPEDPVCRVNRALILSHLGRFEDARRDLEWAVKRRDSQAMAHWHLARLSRQTAKQNRILAIRKALQASTDPREVAFLAHALFKTYDDLGEYAAAWQALQQTCSAILKRRPYARAEAEQLFESIRQCFPHELPAGAPASTAVVPIFIVGMHRSGTSLIERMLGASPVVRDMGETRRLEVAIRHAAGEGGLEPLDGELLRRSASAEPTEIRRVFMALNAIQASGWRFQTEKSPDNFLHIGLIRRAMPEARVIHMRREPVDLCFANLRELFGNAAAYSYALEDLAHYHRLYVDLMAHWHRVCPGFVLDVDYEALVRDPIAQSRRVFEFCGLDWNESVIDLRARADAPVSTLSSVQVRQAVNTASVGRWRPYAAWLGPLLQGCRPAAE